MRVALVTLVGAAVVPLSFAAASGLGGLSTTKVGSGDAVIARCDTDGFSPSYTTSGGNVASVTVDGIADPGCEGATLRLSIVNASGASIATGGPQTVPADADTVDNSLSVTVSPQPAAATAAGVHISVVGP
jgi:hypothetical protein